MNTAVIIAIVVVIVVMIVGVVGIVGFMLYKKRSHIDTTNSSSNDGTTSASGTGATIGTTSTTSTITPEQAAANKARIAALEAQVKANDARSKAEIDAAAARAAAEIAALKGDAESNAAALAAAKAAAASAAEAVAARNAQLAAAKATLDAAAAAGATKKDTPQLSHTLISTTLTPDAASAARTLQITDALNAARDLYNLNSELALNPESKQLIGAAEVASGKYTVATTGLTQNEVAQIANLPLIENNYYKTKEILYVNTNDLYVFRREMAALTAAGDTVGAAELSTAIRESTDAVRTVYTPNLAAAALTYTKACEALGVKPRSGVTLPTNKIRIESLSPIEIAEIELVAFGNTRLTAKDILSFSGTDGRDSTMHSNMFDQSTDYTWAGGSVFGTSDIAGTKYIEMKLAEPLYIQSVTIYAPTDCCKGNLRGATLRLLDPNNTVVANDVLTGAQVESIKYY